MINILWIPLLALLPQDTLTTDLPRFPNHFTACRVITVVVEHQDWLNVQMRVGVWSSDEVKDCDLDGWNEEVDYSMTAWILLRDASTEKCVREYRLDKLKELREHLGEVDYFCGRMPPPVPVHRFRRID